MIWSSLGKSSPRSGWTGYTKIYWAPISAHNLQLQPLQLRAGYLRIAMYLSSLKPGKFQRSGAVWRSTAIRVFEVIISMLHQNMGLLCCFRELYKTAKNLRNIMSVAKKCLFKTFINFIWHCSTTKDVKLFSTTDGYNYFIKSEI